MSGGLSEISWKSKLHLMRLMRFNGGKSRSKNGWLQMHKMGSYNTINVNVVSLKAMVVNYCSKEDEKWG